VLFVWWSPVWGPAWLRQLADLVVLSAPLVVATVIGVRVAAARRFTRAVLLGWRWTDIVLGLGTGLLMRALLELIAPTTGTLLAGFGDVALAGVVVLALGAAFVTPVVEELFFRGVVLAALLDVFEPVGRAVAATAAVTLSSTLFAGMHVVAAGGILTWGALLSPLLVGVGCGILFAITRRLAASVVAHVVFNAIGVALLVW
jgi:membrane protease YdiL (CAAX protease family)